MLINIKKRDADASLLKNIKKKYFIFLVI